MTKQVFYLFFVIVLISSASALITTTGLRTYYNFSDTNGYDAMKNNNGTFGNGATTAAGYFGNGLSLDGVNDWFNISNFNMFTNDSQDRFMINFWVKPNVVDTSANDRIFRVGNSTPTVVMELFAGNSQNETSYTIVGKSVFMKQGVIEQGAWEMVTLVRNGSTMKFYKNGALTNESLHTRTPFQNIVNISIGRPDANGLNGVVDEFAYYTEVVSDVGVNGIYQNYTAGYSPFNVSVTTTYYFAQNGSDSNPGTQAAPFKTVNKANSVAAGMTGGDSLLFQCGHTWNLANDSQFVLGNGIAGVNINYGAYGNCIKDYNNFVVNKPMFVEANITTNTACFSNVGTGDANIWKWVCGTPSWQTIVVYNISSNYSLKLGTSFGVYNWTKEELNTQGQYFANETSPYELWIYSTSNPVTYYGNVMRVFRRQIMYDVDIHDFTISNFSFAWSASHGIALEENRVKNIRILDNDFSYIGGGYFQSVTSRGGTGTKNERYGNAVQFFKNVTNADVRGNRCWETYDACFTNQGTDKTGVDFQQINVTYSYNVAWNSSYCYEFFQSDSGSRAWNMSYHHNTCVGAGLGWYYPQRYNSINGRCIRIGTNYNVSDLKIYDNLCMDSEEYAYGSINQIQNKSGIDIADRTITTLSNETWYSDYNLWYKNITAPYSIGTTLIRLHDSTNYATVNAFSAANNRDIHSKNQSTDFKYLANNEFNPALGSIACSMSSTGSYVGALPCAADTISPNPITGLSGTATNDTIFLTWVNPIDYDYNLSQIWMNGVHVLDSNSPLNYANLISLTPNTTYHFDVISMDSSGNFGTNATINITTGVTNSTGFGGAGTGSLSILGSIYTLNLSFLQKPFFLFFNLSVNNTNPSVYDYQSAFNTYSVDFAGAYRPSAAQVNIELFVYKDFYNFANYSNANIFLTEQTEARYQSVLNTYCYRNSTSSYVLINTYTGPFGGTYETITQNISIPQYCMIGENISVKYGIINKYGSGFGIQLFDSQIKAEYPYYIKFHDITISNSTNETTNFQFFNLTGRANNETGAEFNISFWAGYDNTFNYNLTYDFIYNKSVFFRILDPFTKNLTNATCSYNGVNYGRNGTFNLTFVSSSENILRCSESSIYANSSYSGYPEDIVNVTMNSIYAFECTGVAGEAVAYNFTVKDEDNWTTLEGNNIYVDLLFGTQALSFQKNNTNSIALCVQNGQDYDVNGEVRLSNGYYTKYFLRDAPYNNQTRFINIYDKSDITQYSDLVMTIRDTAFLPMQGIIAKLDRYYPANHTWITVQQDISGTFGNVFFKIIEETTEYRLNFYRNASSISGTTDIKFKCTSGLCSVTYNLKDTVSGAANNIVNYNYNNNTEILTVSWDDSTGSTGSVRVLVTKETFTGRQTIVDDITYASAATKEYDLSGNTGTFSIKIYQDSDTPTISDFIVVNGEAIYRFISVTASGFWSFLIMAIFIGMGILNPVGVVFMGLIGLFVISILGINPVVDITFIIFATVISAIIGNKVE